MNFKNIFQNPKNKILRYFILVLPFLIIIILFPKTNIKTAKTTIPLVPLITQKSTNKISLKNINNLNLEQKIIFDWNQIEPILPTKMNEYTVTTPIINTSTIISLANKFNFVSQDNSTEEDKSAFFWNNKTSSLFASTSQNQIFYRNNIEIPIHKLDISPEDSVMSSKEIINNLFGADFSNTLNDNPEIQYLNKIPNKIEEEPILVTNKENNLISIKFKQKIDNLPLVTQSRNGEILSIIIDTNKNLYSLNLYGGYSLISKQNEVKTLNLSQIKNLANTEALRITYSKNIGSENAYTKAKIINVSVTSIDTGYYQIDGLNIIPVYIINGVMSAKGVASYPATYIIPAKN